MSGALLLFAIGAEAAVYTWIGDSNKGTPGAWAEKGNWNPSNRVPDTTDVATFSAATAYTNNPVLSIATSVLGVDVSGAANKTIGGSGILGIGASNFQVQATAGNITVNPVLAGSGAVNVNAGFSNTLTLTNGNTYSGGTRISGGTLMVKNAIGSATGAGIVTVNTSGTLGGTGTVSGNVTVNGGSINPGENGIGTLRTGTVTWNASDSWKVDIGTGNTSDLLIITGSLNKGTLLSGGQWYFDFQGSTVQGVFRIVEWSASTTMTATNFGAQNVGGGNSATFAIKADGGSGQDYLEVTIVPEPAAYALLAGFIVFGLILIRRRRIA